MPPCIGLCANIELARISGFIVREIYGIAPRRPRTATYQTNTDTALKMLDDWHSQLPSQLQLQTDQALRDPACCTLHMSYNQLILLTTRPMFFARIKRVVAQRTYHELSSSDIIMHETYTRTCTEAAERNMKLARLLQATGSSWLQSGLHFLFNAAVALLLSRISSAYDDKNETNAATESARAAEIAFAIRVFEQEAEMGTNYPADCCRVLQGLNALSDRCVFTRCDSNTQQRSHIQAYHTSDPHSLTTGDERCSNGPNDDCSVYQEMLAWTQTDHVRMHDTLHI